MWPTIHSVIGPIFGMRRTHNNNFSPAKLLKSLTFRNVGAEKETFETIKR
jgi:hypothetical protein